MEKHEQELRRVASENLAMMAVVCEFMARFARSHPACAERVREGFDCAIEHMQIEAMRPTPSLPRYDYKHATYAAEQLRRFTLPE
jgi:hypothetical protein